MLQRDPKKRATLEQIESHEWLQGVDPSPATKLSTPLVSHRSLSEEEHGSIIQRMVLGGIADRDSITEYVILFFYHGLMMQHKASDHQQFQMKSTHLDLSFWFIIAESLVADLSCCVVRLCFRSHVTVYMSLFRALESNQYNHITATYFLLAERMLREKQEKELCNQTRSPSPSKAQFRYIHSLNGKNRDTSTSKCVLNLKMFSI